MQIHLPLYIMAKSNRKRILGSNILQIKNSVSQIIKIVIYDRYFEIACHHTRYDFLLLWVMKFSVCVLYLRHKFDYKHLNDLTIYVHGNKRISMWTVHKNKNKKKKIKKRNNLPVWSAVTIYRSIYNEPLNESITRALSRIEKIYSIKSGNYSSPQSFSLAKSKIYTRVVRIKLNV